MTVPFTTQSLQDALTAKLALNFGTEPGEATDQEMLKACALVLRDVMALRGVQTAKETKKEQKKQVHYLSLEFLMGQSADELVLYEPTSEDTIAFGLRLFTIGSVVVIGLTIIALRYFA